MRTILRYFIINNISCSSTSCPHLYSLSRRKRPRDVRGISRNRKFVAPEDLILIGFGALPAVRRSTRTYFRGWRSASKPRKNKRQERRSWTSIGRQPLSGDWNAFRNSPLGNRSRYRACPLMLVNMDIFMTNDVRFLWFSMFLLSR